VPLDRVLLANEFRSLRKGRGLLERHLSSRLGTQLAYLCEISASSDPALLRERVGSTVANLAKDLPPDLRLAVGAALALTPGVQHRFLTERVDWLAGRLNCDGRTARRRIDHGFEMLVEEAIRQEVEAVSTPPPVEAATEVYCVEFFRGLLRLDTPTPELIEERTIVATQDDVAEIVVALSLPRTAGGGPRHEVAAQVLHGGRIKRPDHLAENHFRFVVQLPRPLRTGEKHDYTVQFTVPDGQPIGPHYTVVPLRPCRRSELIVRFDPRQLPLAAWLLDGVPPRVIDSRQPAGPLLTPDGVGEINLAFEDVVPGLGYGVAWVPAESAGAR
jgi:hypothetical protein